MSNTKAFTMMELIFVIVIIGILASIAIPKLWVSRDDAYITKARTQVAAIRASISNYYAKNIMSGNIQCPELEGGENNYVFENILTYPIAVNQQGINWTLEGNNSEETNYSVVINGFSTVFTYEKNTSKNCPFNCNTNDQLCKDLTE